jgi:hypothetical protein
MTFRRATRKAAAIATLLAFLLQGALAFAMNGSHASHAHLDVPAATVHDVITNAHDPAAGHHPDAAEAMSAGEAACDDERGCLCCIGSCASVLPAAAAAPAATPRAQSPRFEPAFHLSRNATTHYRPPIAL